MTNYELYTILLEHAKIHNKANLNNPIFNKTLEYVERFRKFGTVDNIDTAYNKISIFYEYILL